jgi:hypothetical protein
MDPAKKGAGLFVQTDVSGDIPAADKQHLDVSFDQNNLRLFPRPAVVRDVGSGSLGSVSIPVKASFPAEATPASR